MNPKDDDTTVWLTLKARLAEIFTELLIKMSNSKWFAIKAGSNTYDLSVSFSRRGVGYKLFGKIFPQDNEILFLTRRIAKEIDPNRPDLDEVLIIELGMTYKEINGIGTVTTVTGEKETRANFAEFYMKKFQEHHVTDLFIKVKSNEIRRTN